MENGVEIIGTIITDVDRNAEKIVFPKYVEGTLWNMSLCNIKCIEVEDGHMVWVDDDGMPYDIAGVDDSDTNFRFLFLV